MRPPQAQQPSATSRNRSFVRLPISTSCQKLAAKPAATDESRAFLPAVQAESRLEVVLQQRRRARIAGLSRLANCRLELALMELVVPLHDQSRARVERAARADDVVLGDVRRA